MERTKFSEKLSSAQLHAFASALVARANLSNRLGFQYQGDRDLYKALGYPNEIKYEDFFGRYGRQDIAKAIIDRPVKATWQGPLQLVESDKSEDTPFEKEWDTLSKHFKVKTMLSRIDKLTSIGRYGVLLLGLDDIKNKEGYKTPVASGKRILKYLKPFGESSAKITELVSDPRNERYGKPLIYAIEISDTNGHSSTVEVHHSRVIHITEDLLESEVYGTPKLESVYNRLMDLEKIVGGDGEMFWRGARPGYEGKVDPNYQMTEEMKQDLKDQLDEYERNLRRFLINEGVDIQALAQQLADPSNHVDVQLQMISAVTGIPKRILTGSERGELASTQDTTEWKDYIQTRRDSHAEPDILRPFVDRLIELKILSTPENNYTIKWNDLYSLSEKERVDVGKARANALREYTYNAIAQELIPPDAFNEFFLGFTKEQITLITAMRNQQISDDDLSELIEKLVDVAEPTPIPAGKPIPKKKTKKPVVEE